MSGGPSSNRLGKPRLLIVEDESLVAMDLEERLPRLGYEVSGIADTAEHALACARSRPIDLVLMDIHLRGPRDGIDAATELRRKNDLPVVFLTAHSDDSTLQRAGMSEPFGYVTKPFGERELRAAIEIALCRHAAESRLRKLERWLATTLQSIGDGVIATDSTGMITFMNAVAETLTAWTDGQAIGRSLSEVFIIAKNGGEEETTDLLQRAMTDGRVITLGEGRSLRTREGRLIPVNDSVAPIRDDRNEVTGCVVIFRNNTKNLESAQERMRLETKMQETQRLESLGVMASGIAHDFNNMLVAVTCNASIGRSMLEDDSPLEPFFRDIEAAAERAAKLCSQMLVYAGKGRVKMESVDLSRFCRQAAQLLNVSMAKNVALKLELAGDLPPMLADSSQLQQVLMNLVINASEAFGKRHGQVVLRTRAFAAKRSFLSTCRVGSDLDEGNYLLLEVVDNGQGMTPDVLSRIFDPFFSTKFTGRGLGLAAVIGIVRSHGGALFVESTPGSGTIFRVLFPPQKTETAGVLTKKGNASWKGSGRVLFIDDEEFVRLSGAAVLRHIGFSVDTAEDGEDGIEKALTNGANYCAIFIDLTMPRIDGRHAFLAIRAKFPKMPIALMSGYSEEEAESLMRDGEPTVFISKPFTLGDLTAKPAPLLD